MEDLEASLRSLFPHLLHGHKELFLVRLERSNTIGERLLSSTNKARLEWDTASLILTNFKSRNQSLTLPEQLMNLSRMEIEKQAKEQKYLLVRKEYELLMLDIAKATPPMIILDSATYPTKKTKPRPAMMIVAGLIAALTGTCIYIVGRDVLVDSAGGEYTECMKAFYLA